MQDMSDGIIRNDDIKTLYSHYQFGSSLHVHFYGTAPIYNGRSLPTLRQKNTTQLDSWENEANNKVEIWTDIHYLNFDTVNKRALPRATYAGGLQRLVSLDNVIIYCF